MLSCAANGALADIKLKARKSRQHHVRTACLLLSDILVDRSAVVTPVTENIILVSTFKRIGSNDGRDAKSEKSCNGSSGVVGSNEYVICPN